MSAYLSERIKRLRGKYKAAGRIYFDPAPKIVCADGLDLSVQASQTHYCQPRDDDGPWFTFEVGYPSQRIEALMPFCENPEDPTGTVYARVPGHIIEQIIAEHGGEKS